MNLSQHIRSRFHREQLLFAGCIWTMAIFSLCQSEWHRLHMGLKVDWFSMSFYFFIPAAIWTAAYHFVRRIYQLIGLNSGKIQNWFIHACIGVVLAFAIKILALLVDFELKDFVKPMGISFPEFLNTVRYLVMSSVVDNVLIYWILVIAMRFTATDQPQIHSELANSDVAPDVNINGVQPADIRVIEAFGNYIKIHSSSPVICVRGTIKSMMATLDPKIFIRVHRSFIVNKAQVRTFISGRAAQVEMNDGQCITVSSGYRKQVEESLASATADSSQVSTHSSHISRVP